MTTEEEVSQAAVEATAEVEATQTYVPTWTIQPQPNLEIIKFEFSGRSADCGQIAEALSKAQEAMDSAEKSKYNPGFKSNYADLASVIKAAKGPLGANGLAYVQTVEADGPSVTCFTELFHTSGEFFRGRLRLQAANQTAQGIGSAITYARRYALAAILGIASEDEDDDAQAAQGEQLPAAPPKKFGTPNVTPNQAQRGASVQGKPQPTQAPVQAPSQQTQTAQQESLVKKAAGLFGGRLIDAAEGVQEIPPDHKGTDATVDPEFSPASEFDPENDNEPATDQEVKEAWREWGKVYGNGPEARDKLISIGVKTLQGNPPKKSLRLMREHINGLSQQAGF